MTKIALFNNRNLPLLNILRALNFSAFLWMPCMKRNLITGCLLLFLIFPAVSIANNIRVLNQNFESDAIPPDLGVTSYASGWIDGGYGTFGIIAPVEGEHYDSVNNRGQAAFLNEGARISQLLNVKLQEDESYTLSFESGRPADAQGHNLVARLKADGLVLAQLHIETSDEKSWTSRGLTFTADRSMPVGKNLAVEFQNMALKEGRQVHIDNVSLAKAGTGLPLSQDDSGDNGLAMIPVDLTLKVPEDYATINDALMYLDSFHIKAGRTVTISVSDCTSQIFTSPIEIKHLQGDSIHIIGNQNSPESCVLNFRNSTGFLADNKRVFGYIDGFHISGSNQGGASDYYRYGAHATNGGIITLGPNIISSDFLYGVYASRTGVLIADGITVSGNFSGVASAHGGIVRSNNSNAIGNAGTGIGAGDGGIMISDNSVSSSNTWGFNSYRNSYVKLNNSTSELNSGYGYAASSVSFISAINANEQQSGNFGFAVWAAGFIDRSGSNSVYSNPELNTLDAYFSLVK